MSSSSLEITEKEYLIKLKRSDFDLSFINLLLSRIQSEVILSSFIHEQREDRHSPPTNLSGEDPLFDRIDDK